MRPEGNNPLDLNNLPSEDYNFKQQKQQEESTSSSAGGGGGGDGCGKEKSVGDGKVYECRFCSLKFCKSQALGGHMNRHRQERETETLNKARQLVFTNDLAPRHLSYVPSNGKHMNDPRFPFGSMYPPPLPHMYPSSPRLLSFQSQFPPANNEYLLGHVISEGNYNCVGAPVSSSGQEEGMEWGRRQVDR